MEFHYNVYGAFRDPRADIELARAAVDAGFEGVWIGEHFHPWIESRPYAHHAFGWLASMLTEIPDVIGGTSVSCPVYRYEPPVLAQQLATLDRLHPGRVHLGVGTGEFVNEAPFMDEDWPPWRERADRVVECLEICRTLWTSDGYVDIDGDFYSYQDLKVATQPTRPLEIHWAAWGPTSSRYAGRYSGNLITPADPDHVEKVVRPRFEEGLEGADRDWESSTLTVEMKANLGDVDRLVIEVRERGEYVPGKTELDNPDPRSVQEVGRQQLQVMSDAEVAEVTNIRDDPEEFVEQIRRYEHVGVDRLIVGSTCGDPRRTIDAFRDVVMPAFD